MIREQTLKNNTKTIQTQEQEQDQEQQSQTLNTISSLCVAKSQILITLSSPQEANLISVGANEIPRTDSS